MKYLSVGTARGRVRGLAILALCLFALSGCSGDNAPTPGEQPVPGPGLTVQPDPPASTPAFPRSVSAAFGWDEFPAAQPGAGFDDTFGFRGVTVSTHRAVFTPEAVPNAISLEKTAWAVYPLRCYREATTAELHFEWEGMPPADGTCWIGLPDWSTGTWKLQLLPAVSSVPIDPLTRTTEDHRTWVAVLLTGDDPATLESVSCVCDPDGTEAFNLYAPMWWAATFLTDMDGNRVKEWPADYRVNSSVYLLENGDVLRTNAGGFSGENGKFERLSWDGEMLWSWDGYAEDFIPHHDIAPMPNGNIIMLGWQVVPREAAIAAGRIEAFVPEEGLRMTMLIEVMPTGPTSGEIVWEWRSMDHLVQNVDELKGNFGEIDGNHRLIDINYSMTPVSDYLHANSVDYSPELDQVMISMRSTSELVVIDHSTTTEEAAGHSGGRLGHGGDYIYRWGNPVMYGTGAPEQQRLFFQHDAEWIPWGHPGAGNILVFNNDAGMPESMDYSSIVEIVPPLNEDGSYFIEEMVYGPADPVWSYTADPPESFYASYISSSQRLPDGNTLICSGPQGYFFEVTPEGETVWDFTNETPPFNNQVFRVDRYYLFTPWLGLDE